MRLPFLRHPLLRDVDAEPPPWSRGTGGNELTSLVASRPRRLARLRRVLEPLGINLDGEPVATLGALDRWSLATWPRVVRRAWVPLPFDPVRHWPAVRGEEAAAATLVVDLGVALGELAMRLAPTLAWGVDRFHEHDGDDTIDTFGRAVLLDPTLPDDTPSPPVCSPIDLAITRFQSVVAFGGWTLGFLEGLRPVLWASHRHLYVGPDRVVDAQPT